MIKVMHGVYERESGGIAVICLSVLVIGFDPVVYSANSSGGSVAITVKVLQGSLAVAVSVRVFTEDGTAACKWPSPPFRNPM